MHQHIYAIPCEHRIEEHVASTLIVKSQWPTTVSQGGRQEDYQEKKKMPEPDMGMRPTWKVEGKKAWKLTNRSGPNRKEYTSKVVGLESHTFDVGNAKYAAKFQKSIDAIAI